MENLLQHIQDFSAWLHNMAPKEPLNYQSQAETQRERSTSIYLTPGPSNMKYESPLQRSPIKSSSPSLPEQLGFEDVKMPSPTTATQNVKQPNPDQATNCRKAVDLTTEYEDIDTATLEQQIVEPRPRTPPREYSQLSELEKHGKNKGLLLLVAKKAQYWHHGPRYLPLNNKFNFQHETPEFITNEHKVKADLRLILDHVGKENLGKDKGGTTDKAKVADFFRRVAEYLTDLGSGAEDGVVDLESFQVAIAEGLYRADLPLMTERLVVFTRVGRLVRDYKIARKEHEGEEDAEAARIAKTSAGQLSEWKW